MNSLKQRFPAYSRALRLYPRAYCRQYGTQTLQTLADILDDPDLSRFTKTKLHLGAWLNLCTSIPRQRLLAATRSAAYQPNVYFRNRSIFSLLLIAPLALSVLTPIIFDAVGYKPQPSNVFLNTWSSVAGTRLWLIALPLIATLNALYAITIWFAARQKWPKSKRPASNSWGTKLSLAGLLLIGTAGIAFLGLVTAAQYMNNRHIHRIRDLSMAYQTAHPTLACTLLPLNSARLIAGSKTLYLNNDDDRNTVPYSGILSDSNDIRRTSCTYQNTDLSKFGITIDTREAFSPAGQQQMYGDFSDQQALDNGYNWQPFSLLGYQGFYGQQSYGFGLSMWAKNYWLQVDASTLGAATTTMQTMIGNLDKELAARSAAKLAASTRQIMPLPTAKPTISANDQTRIEYAIMDKNVHIPAGTELHANVTSVADDQASGTFTYSTGLRGTFVAQKKQGSWSVISYQEYKK
jgi:hypothetical protein